MKFTLFAATLAVASGLKFTPGTDINFDEKLDALKATQKSYLDGYQKIRTLGVNDQEAADAWRAKFDKTHYDY